MNTAKHTPGPWVVDDEVSADEAGQETLGVYAEQGGYIAGIHCGPDTTIDEQDKANAHLIAAAPAMYEALQNIDDQLDQFTGKALEELGLVNALLRIRQAIAQAEGK
jgi:accessory colonization factor AcfC